MSDDGSARRHDELEVLVLADDRRVRRALVDLVASIEGLRARGLEAAATAEPTDLAAVTVLCDVDCAADGVVAELVAARALRFWLPGARWLAGAEVDCLTGI